MRPETVCGWPQHKFSKHKFKNTLAQVILFLKADYLILDKLSGRTTSAILDPRVQKHDSGGNRINRLGWTQRKQGCVQTPVMDLPHGRWEWSRFLRRRDCKERSWWKYVAAGETHPGKLCQLGHRSYWRLHPYTTWKNSRTHCSSRTRLGKRRHLWHHPRLFQGKINCSAKSFPRKLTQKLIFSVPVLNWLTRSVLKNGLEFIKGRRDSWIVQSVVINGCLER